MQTRSFLPVLLLSPMLLLGLNCVPRPGGGPDTGAGDSGPGGGSDDTGAITATDDTGTAALTGFDGTIQGIVSVGLYDFDGDCEVVERDWSSYEEWPFGGIWVYAFTEDEGDEDYLASEAFLEPSIDGNAYSLTVLTEDYDQLQVGATLDFNGDRILASDEPVGVYAETITAHGGETIVGVDVSILAYWNPLTTGTTCTSGGISGSGGSGSGSEGSGSEGSGDGGGSGGDGSGSGSGSGSDGGGTGTDGEGGEGGSGSGDGGVGSDGDDGTTTMAGDVIVTEAYAAGEVAVMLMTAANEGPLLSTIETPEPEGGGAVAPYSLSTTSAYGDSNLIGCWDSNFNMLFDGDDKCGAAISESGVDANPLDVTPPEDFDPQDIEIPLDDYEIDLVPFVVISGELFTDEGTFDAYPAGTDIWIAAMKFLRSAELDTTELVDGSYDTLLFSGGELTGQSALPFELFVPSNTVIYLLAFADTDGDGVLNEPSDPIASGSSADSGRVATGSSNQMINMEMHPYAE